MFESPHSELANEIVSLLVYFYRGQATDVPLLTYYVNHHDAVAEQRYPVILLLCNSNEQLRL